MILGFYACNGIFNMQTGPLSLPELTPRCKTEDQKLIPFPHSRNLKFTALPVVGSIIPPELQVITLFAGKKAIILMSM